MVTEGGISNVEIGGAGGDIVAVAPADKDESKRAACPSVAVGGTGGNTAASPCAVRLPGLISVVVSPKVGEPPRDARGGGGGTAPLREPEAGGPDGALRGAGGATGGASGNDGLVFDEFVVDAGQSGAAGGVSCRSALKSFTGWVLSERELWCFGT